MYTKLNDTIYVGDKALTLTSTTKHGLEVYVIIQQTEACNSILYTGFDYTLAVTKFNNIITKG